eukprot:8244219-Lingulodinium_polyedra.AAC.1
MVYTRGQRRTTMWLETQPFGTPDGGGTGGKKKGPPEEGGRSIAARRRPFSPSSGTGSSRSRGSS